MCVDTGSRKENELIPCSTGMCVDTGSRKENELIPCSTGMCVDTGSRKENELIPCSTGMCVDTGSGIKDAPVPQPKRRAGAFAPGNHTGSASRTGADGVNVPRDTHHAWQTGTVLVCGASSQIGHFLLPELARAGAGVLALSRNPQPEVAGVTWLQGTLPHAPATAGLAISICSFAPLDALAAWIETDAVPRLERVVATSSMSAESKQASP